MRQQPFASPGEALEALEHHGIKGMKWGVRKEYVPVGGSGGGGGNSKGLRPGTPEFQQMVERFTRTDHPQVLMPGQRVGSVSGSSPKSGSGKIAPGEQKPQSEHHGLTKNQKIVLAVGAVSMAGAGYVAYRHFTGGQMNGLEIARIQQNEKILEGMKLPKSWDVSGLKNGPISTQRLGDLSGGHINARLKDEASLVINTSRGYADILPKEGFSNPFAAEQHASATRVLEQMREKYPTIRNMNIEVVPFSRVPGMGDNPSAMMAVQAMRAGEARLMYNDLIDKPTAAMIHANRHFLPGLGAKDYLAHHEMGHLFAAAHGELPPSYHLLTGEAGPAAFRTWTTAEPRLHKRMFAKHGFTFTELSKISKYAATQPAEAMAELIGHYLNPEMRVRLTPSQLARAEAMVNEMGGLT